MIFDFSTRGQEQVQDAVERERKSTISDTLAIAFLIAMVGGFYYYINHMGGTAWNEKQRAKIDSHLNDSYFRRDNRNYQHLSKARERPVVSTRFRRPRMKKPPHATPRRQQQQQQEKNAAVAAERRRYHIATDTASENLSMNDVSRAVAAVTGKGGPGYGHADSAETDKYKSKVIRVKSTRDGEMYFVAADLPQKKKAADKLAEVHRRAQTLLQSISEQLEGGRRIKSSDGVDITDNMKTLVRKHYNKRTPFAEYYNPMDKTVGVNSEKGSVIEMCLRGKQNPNEWNSDNTLFRVHMHELAHSADFHYRADGEDGHGPVFKRLHQHLIGIAENLGLYNCAEYKRSGKRFCSLRLTEEYCAS